MKDKVTFKTTVGGEEVELTTISPNSRISTEAQLVHASAWAKAAKPLKDSSGKIIREAAPLRIEIEKSILTEHEGVWSKEQDDEYKEVNLRLVRNEKRIKSGASAFKNFAEAVSTAWQMREDRDKWYSLRMRRNSLNENSAEAFADNARLNYLVYACTQKDGQPFYSSLDDYYAKSNEQYSSDSATSLIKLMNDVEDVDKTPENEFLYNYGFVDKQYRRINDDGKLVDVDGKLVNEFGQLVDEQGNILDIDGDKLTADGEFDVTFVPFVDEDGQEILPKSQRVKSTEKAQETKTINAVDTVDTVETVDVIDQSE